MGSTDLIVAMADAESNPPRIRENFDLGWKFSRGDFLGAQIVEFSDANWKNVTFPHDWSIEGPFDENEPAAHCGGYLPTGIGWYRR
jgi:beta-galactosidase